MTTKFLGHTFTEANADLDDLRARADAKIYPLSVAETPADVTNLSYTYGHIKRYGGFVDGATDDSAALERARRNLVQLGGGILRVSTGICIGFVRMQPGTSDVTIRGYGQHRTTIRQPAVSGRRTVTDASIAAGSPVLTSPSAAFTPNDVGQTVSIDGAAPFGGIMIAAISQRLSPTSVILDRVANITVSGSTSHIRIARNVVDLNDAYLGNGTSTLDRLRVEDLTIDGNKANVPDANYGGDLVNHGIIATNVLRGGLRNIRSINCHNTGVAWCIDSDYAEIDGVTVEGCGNTITGMPGFDINSSSYGHYKQILSIGCCYGFRQLDNCYENHVDVITRQSTNHGVIIDNQVTNESVGGSIRASVEEAGGGTGAVIGANCRGMQIDLDVSFSGCTRSGHTITPVSGIDGATIGQYYLTDAQKPRGNSIRVVATQNGGAGCIIRANNNNIDVVASDNSLISSLGNYGVEINGTQNSVAVTCRDAGANQRGIVVRPATGPGVVEAGTPATDNTVTIRVPNPNAPFDDQGTRTTVVVGERHALATLDFPNIPAGTAAELTVTVPGASTVDLAVASPVTGIESGLVWSAYASAVDTVTIRLANVTSGGINPASRPWRVRVYRSFA